MPFPSSAHPTLRRAATVGALLALTVPATGALGGVAFAEEPVVASQPLSTADDNAVGANQRGPYDSNGVGLPTGNGVGDGVAAGQPCAGCVGKADNKNPQGQLADAETDGNKGFECDDNQGIGQTNPAHTGCTATPTAGITPAVPPLVETPAQSTVETAVAAGPVAGTSGGAATAVTAPVTAPPVAAPPAQAAPGRNPAALLPAATPVAQAAVATLGAGSTTVTPVAALPVLGGLSQAQPAALAPAAVAPAVSTTAFTTPALAGGVQASPSTVGPASLPFTGGETTVLALLGGALVLTGGAAALAGRRPVTA